MNLQNLLTAAFALVGGAREVALNIKSRVSDIDLDLDRFDPETLAKALEEDAAEIRKALTKTSTTQDWETWWDASALRRAEQHYMRWKRRITSTRREGRRNDR